MELARSHLDFTRPELGLFVGTGVVVQFLLRYRALNRKSKKERPKFLGKEVSGPFTVPSGQIIVTPDTLELWAKEIPEVGVLTTSSIGPIEQTGETKVKNGDYETLISNPGCVNYVKELKEITLPENKFLLISIFGSNEKEFAQVAEIVRPYANGLELNFSCAHEKGFGQPISATPELAVRIFKAVREITDIPLVVKLSANLTNGQVDSVVRKLIAEGAYCFSAVNSTDFNCRYDSENVVRIVERIKKTANIVGKDVEIVSEGGIQTSEDIQKLKKAGASIYGIGESLMGLTTEECKNAFYQLGKELNNTSKYPFQFRERKETLKLKETKISQVTKIGEKRYMLQVERDMISDPGQFVQISIPGYGKRSYTVACESPLTVVVNSDDNIHSKMLSQQHPGNDVSVRGPYGKSYSIPSQSICRGQENIFILLGECNGHEALLLLAQQLSLCGVDKGRMIIYLGGGTAKDFYFLAELSMYGNIRTATKDGSDGFHGTVIDLLASDLPSLKALKLHCYNSGPEIITKAAYDLQSNFGVENIQVLLSREITCGTGTCGGCAIDGLRTCVDGPVVNAKWLAQSKMFGRCNRTASGKLLDW